MSKILQICANLDSRIGGPYQVALAINEYCDDTGKDIKTISFGGEQSNFAEVTNSIQNNRYGVSFAILKDSIRTAVKQSSVLIVHGFYLFSTLFAVLMANHNSRIILFPHGSLNASQINKNRYFKFVFRQIFLKLINGKDLSIACTSSQEVFDVSHAFSEVKTFQTLLGSRICQDIDKLPRKDLTLLTVSRLHPIKNLEICLHLVSLAKTQGLDIKLTVVGEGSTKYKKELQNLTRLLTIEESVEFSGLKSTEEIQSLIDASTVLLQFSHYENFGISVAEAISRNTPVLIGPNVGIADFVLENRCGLVVNLNDLDGIFRDLKCLLNEYPMFVSNCRSVKNSFRWNQIIEDWSL